MVDLPLAERELRNQLSHAIRICIGVVLLWTILNVMLFATVPISLAVQTSGGFAIGLLFAYLLRDRIGPKRPIEARYVWSDQPNIERLYQVLCTRNGFENPPPLVFYEMDEYLRIHSVAYAESSGDHVGFYVSTRRMECIPFSSCEAILGHELAHVFDEPIRLLISGIRFIPLAGIVLAVMLASVLRVPVPLSVSYLGLTVYCAGVLILCFGVTLRLEYFLRRVGEYRADIRGSIYAGNTTGLIRYFEEKKWGGVEHWRDTHPTLENRIALLRRISLGSF